MFRSIPPTGTHIRFKEIFLGLFHSLFKNQSSEKFKREFYEYFQVRDCFLVSSGRAAFTLILKALKKTSEKDEVIIPAYTCFSVPSAIARAGLKISLCDISVKTLNLDPEKLSSLINKNTLAVLPVYHFGLSHDISEIVNLCRKQDIYIIEDVAQGMGAKFQNKYLGTFGDLSFFSLGRGKNITTVEGGIILCQEEEISLLLQEELLNLKKDIGFEYFLKMFFYKIFIHPYLYWLPEKIPSLEIGVSKFSPEFDLSSLSEYQAQLGIYLLGRLEEINLSRIKNAQYLIMALKNLEKISLLSSSPEAYSVYLRLPILYKDSSEREKVYHSLRRKNLGVSKMYPTSLDKIAGIKSYLAPNHSELSNSNFVEKNILTLPTHQFLGQADLDKIIEVIRKGGC
jgi:perosamine synthetase